MDAGNPRLTMQVQVVHAEAQQEQRIYLQLPAGASVDDALRLCGIDAATTATSLGIFGRVCGRNQPLKDGDRVEIYRALLHDPKQARRRRAQQKK